MNLPQRRLLIPGSAILCIGAVCLLQIGCNAADDSLGEDLVDLLTAIPGMNALEVSSAFAPHYRQFVMRYEQPADHQDPDGEKFEQFLSLLHRSPDAPTVLVTGGYTTAVTQSQPRELTQLLSANQIIVEHRFFGTSRPASTDWSLLRTAQASHDLHRVVAALKPFYHGRWISSGASKEGLTAISFRSLYPEDVYATVAYVAPINFGCPDPRFEKTLERQREPECRRSLRDFQQLAVDRKAQLVALQRVKHDYERIGAERVMEIMIRNAEWRFWQHFGAWICEQIPGKDATDEQLIEFIDFLYGDDFSDTSVVPFQPYYYQARVELGCPVVNYSHIADRLKYDYLDWSGLLPVDGPLSLDPAPMRDLAAWVKTSSERIMLIYGEYDPWTTGSIDLGSSADSFFFIVLEGNHWANIERLSPEWMRDKALRILERWSGVVPVLPN